MYQKECSLYATYNNISEKLLALLKSVMFFFTPYFGIVWAKKEVLISIELFCKWLLAQIFLINCPDHETQSKA